MSGVIYAIGRIFVPIVFIVSGYRKFMSIGGVAKTLADKHVPAPMQLETWTGLPRYEVLGYAAATIEVADGRVAAARIAVGACSPVAERLPALEVALVGEPCEGLADRVEVARLSPLSPVDDVRGSAAYRRHAAATLLRRLLASFAP